jgi:hypothetical protein
MDGSQNSLLCLLQSVECAYVLYVTYKHRLRQATDARAISESEVKRLYQGHGLRLPGRVICIKALLSRHKYSPSQEVQ